MQPDPLPHDRPAAPAGHAVRYLTKRQLSDRTTLSQATIQRLKDRGLIPYFQPGGKGSRVLFPSDAIEAAAAVAAGGGGPARANRTTSAAASATGGSAVLGADAGNPADAAPPPSPRTCPKLSGPRPRWMRGPGGR